jgi:hypothetical protein
MKNPIRRKKVPLERANSLSKEIEHATYSLEDALQFEALNRSVSFALTPHGVVIKFSTGDKDLGSLELLAALEQIYSRPTDLLDWIIDLSALKQVPAAVLEALFEYQGKLHRESRKMHLIVPVATMEHPELLQQMMRQLRAPPAPKSENL